MKATNRLSLGTGLDRLRAKVTLASDSCLKTIARSSDRLHWIECAQGCFRGFTADEKHHDQAMLTKRLHEEHTGHPVRLVEPIAFEIVAIIADSLAFRHADEARSPVNQQDIEKTAEAMVSTEESK